MLIAAVAAFATFSARAELSGSGTSADPYRISSVADWDAFAARVNAGIDASACYRLDADIGPVTQMVGSISHPFGGIFKGNGHTLTVDINSSGQAAAPFSQIDGATIGRLKVEGTVTSSGYHAAGLVGGCAAANASAILRCTVAATVNGCSYAGGIVGHGGEGALVLDGCVFSGAVNGFDTFAGGLLGWCDTLTLTITSCICTGTFTPVGGGKYHPIACRYNVKNVTATVNGAYYLNTIVPTVLGVNPTATTSHMIPGAEGTPVSATRVAGQWDQPVAAPDGNEYYGWTTAAQTGRLLSHYAFDDSGNGGTNLLRAAVGLDAIVRATPATPVAGIGEIAAVTDAAILSGLASRDGAVAIPNGQHLAVPVPAALLSAHGRPYTVVMKIRVPASAGWRSLLNMPASNDSDAMVYLHQTTRNLYLKQFNKTSGSGIAASNGNIPADSWTTLTFAFGENSTDVYRDGTSILHATGALAGSYADSAAAGGYILVGADDSGDDGLFYISDLRIYEGAVAVAKNLTGSGTSADPYLISSLDDWSLFAANVNAGIDAAACYRLDANIGSNPHRGTGTGTGATAVTEPVGTSEHPFRGVFLGDGRRITAMINDDSTGAAPFRYIDGATIRDLHVKGEFYGGNHVGGIVGFCGSGSPNVISNSAFSGTIYACGGYVGGLVGHGGSGTLLLDHCYFWGSINGFTAHAGGLLGWCEDLSLTMRDCLFDGNFFPLTGVFHPIACKWRDSSPNVTLVRTYYLNSISPTETGDYLVPGAEGIPVSSTYDSERWFWPVTAADGWVYYRWAPDITISSAAEWDAFARGVNEDEDRYVGRTVTLSADIAVSTMVGTTENPFDGTFEGAGHVIEVSISDASAACTAPFRSIDSATIRNLAVAGSVSGGTVAAGLVGRCGSDGPSVISNCTVAASVSASDRVGGIVGEAGGTLTLADDVFSGTISGSFAHAGGLVGWCLAPSITVRNCLFKGAFSPGNAGLFHPVACKDASASVSATVDKTYYLYSAAPTEIEGFLVSGADGTPVSTTYAAGEWELPVTAADGVVYYKERTVVTLTSATGLVILQDGDILTGTGGENTHVIVVAGASVTIRDADVTQCLDSSACEWAGISCEGDATITLEGTNTLKGGKAYYPGVYVPQGSTLVIRGHGKLTAASNGTAAGIGGGVDGCGSIRIEGGIIDAMGGTHCAGIGVGYDHSCGDIAIVGGTISATGGYDSPGIGCGEGSCGTITIAGGTVTATGIGSGVHGTCGNIVIEGGSVTSTARDYMAGIGSGDTGSCGNITIRGGVVHAQGGSHGAGIGSAPGQQEDRQSVCSNIVITGGVVTAVGGYGSAGIGGGYSFNTCGDIVIGADVTKVTATHGADCSNAIGAGEDGSCGTVTVAEGLNDVIDGDTRTITGQSAQGSYLAWAATNGISGSWNAIDASGIHNVFRYLFDVPTGAFTNPPLISISFDANGRAVIHTPPLNSSATGFGISILATDTLGGEGAASYPLDPSGDTVILETGKSVRLFRLQVTEK